MNTLIIRLESQIIIVVSKRGIKPFISIGEKISITNQTRIIFIAKLNNPRVIILIGKLTILITGLIKQFTRPKRAPKIRIIEKSSLNSIPGTNLTAR